MRRAAERGENESPARGFARLVDGVYRHHVHTQLTSLTASNGGAKEGRAGSGRGQVSVDPQNASVSIAYAQWMGRIFKIGMILFLLLGVADILTGTLTSSWWQLAIGIGFLLASFFYFVSLRRTRRSISLNEGVVRG